MKELVFLTQNKKSIVKLERDIRIVDNYENRWFVIATFNNTRKCERLGEYKTEKDCRSVLLNIADAYRLGETLYTMPSFNLTDLNKEGKNYE